LPSIALLLGVIYSLHLFPSLNWFTIIGLLAIFFAAIFIGGLVSLKKTVFVNKKYLFYTLLFFPGLVQLFAGAGILTMKYSNYLTAFFAAGLLLSLAIGITIHIKNIVRFKS
jgi:hypothetical protein